MTNRTSCWLKQWMASLLALSIAVGPGVGPAFADVKNSDRSDSHTATPIKHVIVIVGENRSFDHLFATYVPKPGETVNNLLSEGIIKPDGTPGANYSKAVQYSADITGSITYQLSPTTAKAPYGALPAPLNGGPTNVCTDNGMCNLGDAVSSEDGLPKPPFTYYRSLLVGGTGLTGKVPDSRITGVNAGPPYSTLAPGPFQITNSTSFPLTLMRIAPFIGFTRCGSRRTAMPPMPRQPIPAVAWRTYSPGPKSQWDQM